MKDPTMITAEEDEEQMIMRRLRNSVDELRRGYRWLDYRMQRVKDKADQSKEKREGIELPEEKVSIRGEPIPFKAYIPMDEVIQYRPDQKAGGGRLVYKGCKLNNRTMHNYRPTIGRWRCRAAVVYSVPCRTVRLHLQYLLRNKSRLIIICHISNKVIKNHKC